MSDDSPTILNVSDRFYELISAFENSRLYRGVFFVDKADIFRLLIKDQVPYSPDEFRNILSWLDDYCDTIEDYVSYCFQLFIGKHLNELVSRIPEGYRTYDITPLTLNDLAVTTNTKVDLDETYYTREVLNTYFDKLHPVIMRYVLGNDAKLTYQEYMLHELNRLISNKSLYEFGRAITIIREDPRLTPVDLPVVLGSYGRVK